MGTNCAPLLADIFLHSYEAEFIQTDILMMSFSLNNHKFSDYVYKIYPVELEIKETTDDEVVVKHLD